MMSLRLLALLLAPLLALGQISRIGLSPNRHHIPSDGLVVLYGMGPDGEENTVRTENLLVYSADLTERSKSGTPVVTTFTVEDDDGTASEFIHQTVSAPDATTYTWTAWILQDAVIPATRFPMFRVAVTGLYIVYFDTQSGASNETAGLSGSHTVTSEGDYWRLEISFTTDSASGARLDIYPAFGANADLTTGSNAAVGTITVLRQQLEPGSVSTTYCNTGSTARVCYWRLETWMNGARNLLISSADLTGWTVSGTPVVTATTVEDNDGAGYEYVYQTVAAPDVTTYTWTVWVAKDAVVPATRFPGFFVVVSSGGYQVFLDTSSGNTTEVVRLNGSHTVTSDTIDGTECWKLVLVLTTDDANGILLQVYPAIGANANLTTTSDAAVGTITVLRQSLTPGSASGEYEATGARQTVYNWALTDRRNLLEYSGALDETDVWTNAGCVRTATTVEDNDGAAWEFVYQTVSAPNATTCTWTIRVLKDAVVPATRFPQFQALVNSNYRVRLDTASGASTEVAGLGGSHTVTSDGSYWKVVIVLTTDDANGIDLRIYPATGANADLTTTSAAAVGTITIASQQLERGSTATHYQLKDASNYAWLDATVGSDTDAGGDANDPSDALIDPGDPTIVAARGGFDGVDDYSDLGSGLQTPLGNDQGTVVVLFKSDVAVPIQIMLFAHADVTPRLYLGYYLSDIHYGIADTTGHLSNDGSSPPEQWIMAAMVYSSGSVTGYVDGVAKLTDTYTGTVSSLDQTFYVGRYTTAYFDGTIPFTAIYDRALAADEIHRIYMNVAHRYCTYRGILCDVLNINPWRAEFDASFGVGP